VRRFLLLAVGALAGCRTAPLPEAQLFPAGTEFTARYLLVDLTRIRYIDAGHGAPVVFLHGLGASMYAWRKNLAAVAAAGFRVIAFDNRGFGLSDKPPAPYDNAAYAHLVVTLMDSLRLSEAVLVGHSMGGAIAAQVAIDFPQRVRGLALVGSAGLGAGEPLLFRMARWPVLGRMVLALRGRGFTGRLLRATYFDPSKVTEPDVDQYYAPVAQPEYGRALLGVLRHFRFDALKGQLDRIATPTVVLWGEEDRWVPIALGRALASGITRSAFVSVPHAGHSVQEEAPDEVNHLVIRFLKDGLPRIPTDLASAR